MYTITKEQLSNCITAATNAGDKVSSKQRIKKAVTYGDVLHGAVIEARRESEIDARLCRWIVREKGVNFGTKKWPDWRQITRVEKVEKITEKSVLTFCEGESGRVPLEGVLAWVIE